MSEAVAQKDPRTIVAEQMRTNPLKTKDDYERWVEFGHTLHGLKGTTNAVFTMNVVNNLQDQAKQQLIATIEHKQKERKETEAEAEANRTLKHLLSVKPKSENQPRYNTAKKAAPSMRAAVLPPNPNKLTLKPNPALSRPDVIPTSPKTNSKKLGRRLFLGGLGAIAVGGTAVVASNVAKSGIEMLNQASKPSKLDTKNLPPEAVTLNIVEKK